MDFTQLSSIRATYALISLLLIVALVNQLEGLVVLISCILLFGALSGKCPFKLLFEKIGFKKTDWE
jgi:hypothetical protein